jgi:hypothetical protein
MARATSRLLRGRVVAGQRWSCGLTGEGGRPETTASLTGGLGGLTCRDGTWPMTAPGTPPREPSSAVGAAFHRDMAEQARARRRTGGRRRGAVYTSRARGRSASTRVSAAAGGRPPRATLRLAVAGNRQLVSSGATST